MAKSKKMKKFVPVKLSKKHRHKSTRKGKRIFSAKASDFPNVGHKTNTDAKIVAVNSAGERVVMGARAPVNAEMNPVQFLRALATLNYPIKLAQPKKSKNRKKKKKKRTEDSSSSEEDSDSQ